MTAQFAVLAINNESAVLHVAIYDQFPNEERLSKLVEQLKNVGELNMVGLELNRDYTLKMLSGIQLVMFCQQNGIPLQFAEQQLEAMKKYEDPEESS